MRIKTSKMKKLLAGQLTVTWTTRQKNLKLKL